MPWKASRDEFARKIARSQADFLAQVSTPAEDKIATFVDRILQELRRLAFGTKTAAPTTSASTIPPRSASRVGGRSAMHKAMGGRRGSVRIGPRHAVRMAAALVLVMFAAPFAAAGINQLAPKYTNDLVTSILATLFPPSDEFLKKLAAIRDCAEHHRVYEANGWFLGFYPKHPECSASKGPWHARALRFTPLNDEQTRRASRILQIIEGGHGKTKEAIAGVNVHGIVRALASGLTVGGTNAFQNGLEALQGNSTGLGIRGKFWSAWDAAALGSTVYLDELARDRIAVESFIVAQGAAQSGFGEPVAASMAAWSVFGKQSFAELTDAEICILFAAAQRPLLIPGARTPADELQRVEARFDRARRRAKERCVQPMLERGMIDEGTALAMNAEIDTASIAAPDSYWANSNPALMLKETMPGLWTLLGDYSRLNPELFDGEIRLTASSVGQQILEESVQKVLSKPHQKLCLRNCNSGQHKVDVLTVVSERNDDIGAILAAYQSGPTLWTGPLDLQGQNMERGRPLRSVASVVKALAAPMLANADIQNVCRRDFAELHDRGQKGFDCSDGVHYWSLRQVIAHSSNLGFAEAIDITGTGVVADWLRSLGGSLSPETSTAQLRRSIVVGGATFSPERLDRAFSAISRAALGGPLSARDAVLFQNAEGELLDLGRTAIRNDAWTRSKDLLSAPLKVPGATLHKLTKPLLQRGCDLGSAAGKTGTVDAADPTGKGVAARLIVLNVSCGGRRLQILTTVASQDITKDISRHLTNADMRRLVLAGLDAALNR